MFTTDVALTRDEKYDALVKRFAADAGDLDTQFSEAWYKLTTRDMGPRARCANQGSPDLPPARPFQHPLPESPLPLPPRKPRSSSSSSDKSDGNGNGNGSDSSNGNGNGDGNDIDNVKDNVKDNGTNLAWSDNSVAFVESVYKDVVDIIEEVPVLADEKRRLLARLAWRCAATYRHTDYLGGCNGALVRLSPQNAWPINEGLRSAFALLAPVMRKNGKRKGNRTNASSFPDQGSSSDTQFSISWADLIVLAGNAAIATAGGPPVKFCPGRSDARKSLGPGCESREREMRDKQGLAAHSVNVGARML